MIVIAVAGLHLVDLRAWLAPELRILHRSYFSDVAIPFAFYFLLCFTDDRVPRLRSAAVKGLAVFLAATGASSCRDSAFRSLGAPLILGTSACMPWALAWPPSLMRFYSRGWYARGPSPQHPPANPLARGRSNDTCCRRAQMR